MLAKAMFTRKLHVLALMGHHTDLFKHVQHPRDGDFGRLVISRAFLHEQEHGGGHGDAPFSIVYWRRYVLVAPSYGYLS